MCFKFGFAVITIVLLAGLSGLTEGAYPYWYVYWQWPLQDVCDQPKDSGNCYAQVYRYAYNANTKSCEVFAYGGCGGNQNNFELKEQCEQACLGR